MGIALEEVRESLPAVRLPEVGDYVTGHLMHMQTFDEIDPETKQIVISKFGKPKKVQVLSVLITDASPGAEIGSAGDYTPAKEGDEARIFVQGATWQWWIDAKKGMRIEVGDVLRWKFEGVRPNPNKMHSDFKDRKFALRKPRPDESANVAICEQRYREIEQAGKEESHMPPLSDSVDF